MIGQGVRIGTVRGIPVKADWSLLVILWLLTWSLATGGLPALASGYSSGAYWFAAVLTSIAERAGVTPGQVALLVHAVVQSQERG